MKIKDQIRTFLYHFSETWTATAVHLFYKRIQVVGEEKIPVGKPILCAVNHQNAFMDPLLIVLLMEICPTFLTRSDVFQHPIVKKIFYLFKMLPIYRQRDGVDTLKKNEEVFNECIRRLEQNDIIVIFAEGNHNRQRRLRPLKKGIGRIAFSALERNNYDLDLQIQPIGINYSDHLKFRSHALVVAGEPIPLMKYKDLYLENPKKALVDLVVEIRNALKQHMHHISRLDHYELIDGVRKRYAPVLVEKQGLNKDLYQEFLVEKALIDHMEQWVDEDPAATQALTEDLQAYEAALKNLRFRDHTIANAPYALGGLLLQALGLLLTLPVFVYGAITNYLPYILPHIFAQRKFRDDHFHSSIKMVGGLFLFSVYYLLVGIGVAIFTQSAFWAVALPVSLMASGHWAMLISEATKKWVGRWRYRWMSRAQHPGLQNLVALRKKLMDQLDALWADKEIPVCSGVGTLEPVK